MDAPWDELPEAFRDAVLHGARGFQGVIPFLRGWRRSGTSSTSASSCGSTRARDCPVLRRREAAAGGAAGPRVGGAHRHRRGRALPLRRASCCGCRLPDDERRREGTARAARSRSARSPTILRELDARLGFLDDVGLGYLTLDRQTRTLSGGEAQRISLANALGSRLVDTLYVLDEPTIGLHPADNDRLLRLLLRLRERGNTVWWWSTTRRRCAWPTTWWSWGRGAASRAASSSSRARWRSCSRRTR
jgi:excinuclease ABC subunit A